MSKNNVQKTRISHSPEEIDIPKEAMVKITRTLTNTQIMYAEFSNHKPTVRRIDKNRLLNINTGEIIQVTTKKNRSQNVASLRKTFNRLRDLINNNFSGKRDELFLTLTYKDDITDSKQISLDFDRFMKRLTRQYGHLEYIKIAEPQGRFKNGQAVWHYHMLLKGINHISNQELERLWSHGFVNIKHLEQVSKVGNYITPYLTDMPLDEYQKTDTKTGKHDIVSKKVQQTKKKFVKGARLQYYPPNMNLYSHSKGIKAPKHEQIPYSVAKEKYQLDKPDYQQSLDIKNGLFTSCIKKEFYNN